MTTLTCKAYRASVIPGTNDIRLEIENPVLETSSTSRLDPYSTKPMRKPEIAAALKVHVSTVDRLSRRKKNPLPLIRGRGRPYILEGNLHHYSTGGNAAAVKDYFGNSAFTQRGL